MESLKSHSLATNSDNNPRKRIFGYDYPHGAEAQHIDFYDRHLTEVRKFFASKGASDVLCEVCWEEGDGWQKICAFLAEPLPDATFPHVNRRAAANVDHGRVEENQRRIAAQVTRLTNG